MMIMMKHSNRQRMKKSILGMDILGLKIRIVSIVMKRLMNVNLFLGQQQLRQNLESKK